MRELCERAVDTALAAGAAYADARFVSRRSQTVRAKNERVDELSDEETAGIGVRVLVGGAWGFACDRELTADAARDAALRACEFARAAPAPAERPLAPVEAHAGTYRTPLERDPFDVPLADKVELCVRATAALRHPDVKVAHAGVRAWREHKIFRASTGADIEQEVVECGGGIDALAVSDGVFEVRSYPTAHAAASIQGGWEWIDGLALEREAPRVAEEAAALLRAPVCPSGRTTVVLDAEQMANQVHESVGHAIELDRIYGTEAAYAGTSFLRPEYAGSFRYGSERMHVTADATTPGGLGTFAFDDEGVPAQRVPVVEAGVLRGFLSSRETAARLGAGHGGSMRADGWNRMPLVRMTNLHLEPGSGSRDELIAGVEKGVYLETNKSWSIDDKRLNFQFGTQVAWEIRNGKRTRLLRDATYTGVTPEFWARLDAVAGPEEARLHGFTNCGKGQPGQSAHVSHRTVPARFRDVVVGVRA